MTIARLALYLAGVLMFGCRITKHRRGFLVMSALFVLYLERRYIRWCGALRVSLLSATPSRPLPLQRGGR